MRSDYNSMMQRVRRERECEQRVSKMDTADLVQLILELEERVAQLEAQQQGS
jgi:hypothetical protein